MESLRENLYVNEIMLTLQPEECTEYRWITLEEVERGVMNHTILDIFKYTKAALKFYKVWKEAALYRTMENARQQVEYQYP